MPHSLPKHLLVLLTLYCAASLAHFAHNAEFLDEYPNMPVWLSSLKVYAAWFGVTAVGLLGLLVAGTRMRGLGVLLIAVYAALGFDGLAHYSLAPRSAHTFAMNFTIWFEVATAAVLLVATSMFLFGRSSERYRKGTPVVLLALLLGAASCATAPVTTREADERELLRLHQTVLDAHLASDIELLLEDEEDEYVIASNGAISRPTREQRRAGLGPYLQATRFLVYRDLVPPVVEVSADGSLGWVIVQIEAQGEQRTESGAVERLEFVSAWIELYRKQNGRWLRVGNVSNFKPDE